MGRTACTEPQCLYKGALYLTFLRPNKNLECTIQGQKLQHLPDVDWGGAILENKE